MRLLRKILRPLVPKSLIPQFFRTWVWLITVYEWLTKHDSDPYLPPARLRFKVSGSPYKRQYLEIGREVCDNISTVLTGVGRNLHDFRSIYDFGCGCGRTLRWLKDIVSDCRLFGSDVDAEAVGWCQKHLDFAECRINTALPPTDYPNNSFDLVIAISVATHLSEEYNQRWLEELKRVLRTGGIALISVHGLPAAQDKLSPTDLEHLKKEGVFFCSDSFWKLYFPDFYQTCFHTPDYIRENWSRYFEVIGHVEKGINNWQDLVILSNS